jgi:CheY-like chemotaxis protein
MTALLRILIVDDNIDAAQMLAMLLQSQRHDVQIAHCGNQALESAAAFIPQLVLLDIGLPGLNGYQVARRLREHAVLCQAVLVAVTGFGQPEDRERCKQAGFDYHLLKPVSIDDVNAIVEEVATRENVDGGAR